MTAKCLGPIPARSTRTIRATLTWLSLILVCASAAVAQKPPPILLHLDPSTTQIRWTLHTNVHTVHGTFKLKSGDVKVDPASGDASGLIVIDATSGRAARAHATSVCTPLSSKAPAIPPSASAPLMSKAESIFSREVRSP